MTEDNKFKKDVAEPDANFAKLDKEFSVDTSTGEVIKTDDVKAEVQQMRDTIKEIENDLPDVDGIILDNIDRANRFLDKVEEQIMNGNISATMMDSCANLINAVTSAATSITGISYNNDVLDIRREELRIRERKLDIDKIANGAKEVHITQNNLQMTREELLEELRNSKK